MDTVKVIAQISEFRKNSIGKTNKRVFKFSVDIANRMRLSDLEQGQVKLAAMLYDIGKISVNDEILNKKTPLSIGEQKILKEHPIRGAEIIQEISTLGNLTPIIRAHYERFAGKGYPDKLKGEQIPLITRIISIADAFDAIVSEKDFNPSVSLNMAIEELKKNKETKFDSEIVDTFLRILKDKSMEEISDYLYKN